MRAGVFCVLLCAGLLSVHSQAEIVRWDTGETIPGTEGIVPGRGVDLSFWNTASRNLDYASLRTMDLSRAEFWSSRLNYAHFNHSTLTQAEFMKATLIHADFTGADLRGADFSFATLTNSDFKHAVVSGADFGVTTGFTKAQLYSTASYQAKDLRGIGLGENDLSGWDFSGQHLAGA